MSKEKKNKKQRAAARKKWLKIGIIVGLVVLAGAVGLLVRWLQTTQQPKDQGAEVVGLLDNPLPKDVTDASDLANDGKYDDANKLIDESLKTADNDKKYELYLQQGANYETKGDNQKALESYQNAAKSKQTATAYQSIGRAAEALGNTQLALENYKKALSLVEDSPTAESQRQRLRAKIQELGG